MADSVWAARLESLTDSLDEDWKLIAVALKDPEAVGRLFDKR